MKVLSVFSLFLALLLPLGNGLLAQDRLFPHARGNQDWVMVPLGLGLTTLGLHLGAGADPITREEIRGLSPDDVNPFDRSAVGNWSPEWAHRSDNIRTGVFGAALLILGVEGARAATDGRSDDALTLATMLGEVGLLTAGATYATKALAGRRRPYLFNSGKSVDERFEIASSSEDEATFSFFSGHSSGVFAAATFASTIFMDIHGRSAWSHLVWGSTLSLATLTAYARVKAGVHYPSDVIVGALVGGGIGYLIPVLHRKDGGEDERLGGGAFQFVYQIRF